MKRRLFRWIIFCLIALISIGEDRVADLKV